MIWGMAAGTVPEKVRQHVVSQALLRRFQEPAGTPGALVGVYDVLTGKTQQRSPKAIGFLKHYIRHQANYMEDLWSEVEDRLPAAFAEIDAQPGLLSPETARTVTDCAALHFVRSHLSRQISDLAFAETVQRFRNDRARLAQLAKLKHGLDLEHADSVLTTIAEDIVRELKRRHETGEVFQQRQEEHFAKARHYLSTIRLTVLQASDQAEFILGDCPAAGVGPNTPPTLRAPLFDASAILMPLGPKAIAILDHSPQTTDTPSPVTPDVAVLLNRAQIAQAFRQVYYRRISGQSWIERSYRQPTATLLQPNRTPPVR